MTKSLNLTKIFKKQFKKRKKDPRWRIIFEGKLPQEIDDQERSPWNFIIECLIQNYKIPAYFYPHALIGMDNLKKQIKRQLNDNKIMIVVIELHFDGHNGDHLLVYITTEAKVFLVGIGTHSELFG